MNLNCNYQFLNAQEPVITVGEVFHAHCKMEVANPIDLRKLIVKYEGSKNYDLKVLKSVQAGSDVNLAFTSYIVGKKSLSPIVLTDGQQDLTIQTPLIFEVKSIIKPDEKPEMFGPISGLSIVVPLVYWLILGSILFLFITSFGFSVHKRIKRRRVLQRLLALEDSSQPIQQFFTTYRRLQRENVIFNVRSDSGSEVQETNLQPVDELLKIVASIEKSLRLYIARTFKIAAFELSWKRILEELNAYYDVVYEIQGLELSELSHEFQKVGMGKNKLEAKDVIYIAEKARKWIEKTDLLHQALLAKDTLQIKKLRGVK